MFYANYCYETIFLLLLWNVCEGSSRWKTGCMNHISSEFRVSPGEYDVETLTMDECQELCGKSNFTYAGIMAAQYCLCSFSSDESVDANDYCKMQCKDVSDDVCASENLDFLTTTVVDLNGIFMVNLTVDVGIGTEGFATVRYNVEIGAHAPCVFYLKAGDGTHSVHDNDVREISKAIRLPGLYTAKLIATDGKNQEVVSNEVEYDVPDLEVRFLLSCPNLVKPGVSFLCEVTVFRGTSLTLTVYSDRSQVKSLKIPDTVIMGFGSAIPDMIVPATEDKREAEVIYLSHDTLPHGYIIGFEYYALAKGKLKIQILTPKCDSKSDSCLSCGNACADPNNAMCGESNQGTFCSISKQCTKTSDTLSHCFKAYQQNIFENRFNFNVDVPDTGCNYQEITPPENIQDAPWIYPGDIIAFESTKPAIVAFRGAKEDEIEIDLVDRDQNGDPLGVRHFLRAVIGIPTTVAFQYEFQMRGNRSVTIDVTNEASGKNQVELAYIAVENPVWNLLFALKEGCTKVNELVMIQASILNGTGVTLKWTCDNEETRESYITDSVDGIAVTNFICTEQRNFTIFVEASNPWRTDIASTEFCCLNVIGRNWEIKTDSPNIFPPGHINLTLLYVGEDNEFPGEAQVNILYEKWIMKSKSFESSAFVLTQILGFSSNGVYNVIVNISNDIDFEVFQTEVVLYEQMGQLEVDVHYTEANGDEVMKDLSGINGTDAPVGAFLHFTCQINGTVFRYIMKFENTQLEINSPMKEFQRQFTKVGKWDLTFWAWNTLEVSNIVPKLIRTVTSTSKLNLQASKYNISQGESIVFTITFGTSDQFTCIAFNAGDDSLITAFGNKDTCLSVIGENAMQWISRDEQVRKRKKKEAKEGKWESDNTMSVLYTYNREGVYAPTAEAFNSIYKTNATVKIDVVSNNPDIWIENNSTDIRLPVKKLRSESFRLETTALLVYTPNQTYLFTWEIAYISNQGSVLKEIDISEIKSKNGSALRIPARFLDVGLYKFVYVFHIYGERGDFSKELASTETHSCFTYLEIVTSPLLPMIIEGGAGYVLRGYGQEVHLEVSAYSQDPDDLNDKNFEVNWSCRRFQRSQIFPPDDIPWSFVNRDRLQQAEVKEECFKRESEVKSLMGQNLVFNTNVLYEFNALYEISAVVRKDTRQAKTMIYLDVLEAIPPGIIIKCEKAVACLVSSNGFLINRHNWLSIRAECVTDCGDEDLYYSWDIYEVDESRSNAFSVSDWTAHAIVDENRLGINQSFLEIYSNLKSFHVKVTGMDRKDPKRPLGVAELYLHVNDPPQSGSCRVNTVEGHALIDTFTMNFDGWTDPEGHALVDYSIYTLVDGFQYHIHYGAKTHVNFVLRDGKTTVKCAVKDEKGGITFLLAAEIEVRIPPKHLLEDWKSSADLMFIMAEGEICRFAQSLAAESVNSRKEREMDHIPLSDVVGGIWSTYCDQPGIDSSYFTIQAREEIEEEVKDKRDVEEAAWAEKISRKMQMAMLLPIESLEDAEVYGMAISMLSENRPLNKESKAFLGESIRNLFDVLYPVEVPHPEDRRITASQIGNIMNCLSETLSNQFIGGEFTLVELEEANEFLQFNLTEPNVFIYNVRGSRQEVNEKVRQMKVEIAKRSILDEATKQMHLLKNVSSMMSRSIVQDLMVGSNPMVIESDSGFKIAVEKKKINEISGLSAGDKSGGSFTLPSACGLLQLNDGCEQQNISLGVVAVSWNSVLDFTEAESLNMNPGSGTLELSLTNREGDSQWTIENATEVIEICLPQAKPMDPKDGGKVLMSSVTPQFKRDDDFLIYHELRTTPKDTALKIDILPEIPGAPLIALHSLGYKPSLLDYDGIFMLRNISRNGNGIYSVLVNLYSKSSENESYFYVAVGHLANISDPEMYFKPGNKKNLTRSQMTNDFSTNYSIGIYTTGCYYFVEEYSKWSSEGCSVKSANSSLVCCACNHLSLFGGGFVVAPNEIDFEYVFATVDFESNLTIYCTLIVTFSLFLILLIWARWKDRKDIQKIGTTPLQDNDWRDKYFYEILVQTGFQYNAGTKSKVNFIISGEDDKTEVRSFSDDQRPIFKCGSVDVFVMAVPRCLGQLNYLRIWHDNSGRGKHASWYLCYVVVKDVQTGLKCEFIVNRWLAVEEGDGLIDHLISVAGREQTTKFSHLFPTASRRSLADNHLWFSVFLRPPRSRFTRVQRLSCCLAVMYLSMLTSAMWYQTASDRPSPNTFKFGPLSLSPEQIGVGLMANLVVFVPSCFMVFLFRKSRPRHLRPSHIKEALRIQCARWKAEYGVETRLSPNDAKTYSGKKTKKMTDEEAQFYQKRKRFTLPWWFVIFGWLLNVTCVGTCLFFLWTYGLQFGEEKTRKWLTSLLVYFVSSILLTEPIKIFFLAFLLSCMCGNPDVGNDDVDDDEEDSYLKEDEEFLHKIPADVIIQRPKYRPMDPKVLEAAKRHREKELKMYKVLKEIGVYTLYLWILIVLSFGNRDPNSFFLREAIINNFIKPGDLWCDFNRVNTEKKFWNWTRKALLPELFANLWYNGQLPLGLRMYTDDRNNLKIGYAVLRQVRVNQENCEVPLQMRKLVRGCAGYGNVINEDSSLYGNMWSDNYTIESRIPPEYKYMTASELDGFPFWGQVDWYGGGGYVVPLIAKRYEDGHKLQQKMTELEQKSWVDEYTRAVFVEFGTYNAQVNLFAVVTILAEFIPGGGIVPYYHIDPIKLLHYHTGSGLIEMASEIGFLIFTTYYSFCEVKAMGQQGRSYFREYWNIAELANLLASYAGIAVEIRKMVVTRRILDIFTVTEGTGYIKLQEALVLDECFCYLIGFLMSLSTLKFLKLLRFNKRIGLMSSTIRLCAKELQSFGLCLLIVLFAFVTLFWLVLGRSVKEFRSILFAFESSISMLLKKFNYEDMEAASPYVAPVAFFTFALTASLVLVNILLTIIIQSFEEVKYDEDFQSKDYELVPFIIDRLKLLTGLGRAKVNPMPPLHVSSLSKGKDTISKEIVGSFSSKVDKLVNFVNAVYFDEKMDFADKDFLYKSTWGDSVETSNKEETPVKKKLRPRKIPRYQSRQMKMVLDF